MHAFRSHTCGELRDSHVGQAVRLSGWVHRIRDHGGLLFIDLRDHYGLTQCVIEPDNPLFPEVETFRAEYVLRIDGQVVARTDDTVNKDLPTGMIEVRIKEAGLLSAAEELPLPVFGELDYPEEVRLRYRYLDLRRERMHRNMVLRSQVISSVRRRMTDQGFMEFQTPILTSSSPEGARDFLVPSRLHPGEFYALPQAPQQFKQLIMVAGFDRYFQIAPCFRDEDPRADRSPGEFYQLDVEMSFVEQEDVFKVQEAVWHGIFTEFGKGAAVTETPFPHITYADALLKYGSDKPDLRNPIEIADVTEQFRGSGFKIFAGMIDKDPKVRVRAIPAPGGGSRAFCDRMNSWAQQQGQPGLGYIFFRSENGDVQGAGPVAKAHGAEGTGALRQKLGLNDGDAVFFVAGDPKKFTAFIGEARNMIGRELNLFEENAFRLAWIVDFPMYEWDETEKRVDFGHNPFSMPAGGLEALENEDPLTINARQYDLACNGYEVASGAIRNHKPEIMYKAFEIAGYTKQDVDEKFAGMINAFKFGAPPHGGIAAGIDRMIMLLAGEENLREVTLFPKNQQAQDLMMNAPAGVSNHQLRELYLRLALPQKQEALKKTEEGAPPSGM